MKPNAWHICLTDPSQTTRFAAEEFVRLINRMDPGVEAGITGDGGSLRIGVTAPESGEDAVRIDVQEGAGYISGPNPRSVLIAVYRFFREAGCVFLRPGRDGEYVPRRDSLTLCVQADEAAAYRHRGICLEGSNSYENVAEMIDFAPKLGFNSYFTQLFRPSFAFKRWYGHENNPYLLPTPVSNETIDAFVRDFSQQAALRGLIHHRIGHGWASKLLGITSGAWHEPNREDEVLPERRKYMALVKGERKLFSGSGIDTNLCYSNPEVQALLTEEVVSWAAAHPETQYLHVWLADQPNNQCECEACRKARPSDHYVDILNRIDAALTEKGLPTKIVFLIYLDLLWEPERARFNNPDRFVLMFAPIRRSYSVPMASDGGKQAAPFVRNGFRLTTDAGGTLPYLKAWQRVFSGDSFVFDYHYMWDYLNDPGCYESVRILAHDMADLRALGLGGMMSCQNQRVFMPFGLGMNVMADTLWTGREDFAAQAPAFFRAAFGEDGEACRTLAERLSALFDPPALRGERPLNAAAYREIPAVLDAFAPTLARGLASAEDPAQHRSWECLAFWLPLCRMLAAVLLAAAEGDIPAMDALWAQTREYVCRKEPEFRREFDVFEFLNVWENRTLYRLLGRAPGGRAAKVPP